LAWIITIIWATCCRAGAGADGRRKKRETDRLDEEAPPFQGASDPLLGNGELPSIVGNPPPPFQGAPAWPEAADSGGGVRKRGNDGSLYWTR